MILDLVARLRAEGRVSIIMIAHNYVHVLQSCDRVNLIQDGEITLRQADGRDVGRGAQRDRRRGVPPRAARDERLRRPELSRGRRRVRHRRRLRDPLRARRRRGGGRRRGARLGGPRVRARRHRARAAGLGRAPAAPVGAAGPRRLHRRPARGGAGGRRRGRDRARAGHRDRHRLHRVDAAAGARRRHAAVPARRPARAPARLPQALEAPRGGRAGRPDQRRGARARRAVARALRRPDLLGVGVRQGPADPRGGPRGLRAHGPLRRGRRLDRLAAVRARDAQHVHGRLQGHLPGRRLPVRGLPARARRALRELRRRTKIGGPLADARRPRRRPDRAGRRVDRAAGGHRRRGRQRRRTRHRARRAGDRSRPDARRHGNVDVPHHER